MITANYNLSQCLDCCHFSKFNCDAKAYTANINTEDSDCFNEKKQIYHTINNDNNSEEPKSEKDNSAINFALSEPSQHIHEC